MPIISLIAAVDEAWGLGKDNQLLCHLPADLKYFKEITMGKPVIMGRKTFESIGKPLPGRPNIIISRTLSDMDGAQVVSSLQHAIEISNHHKEVMIIGGAEIFKQSLPMAKNIYLTQIHHAFNADVFFPKIEPSQWQCVEKIKREKDSKNPYDMTFCHYRVAFLCG